MAWALALALPFPPMAALAAAADPPPSIARVPQALPGSPVLSDTTLATPPATAAIADSVLAVPGSARAAPDSAAAVTAAVDSVVALPWQPLEPSWQARASIPAPALAQLRAGTLSQLLEAVPHASLRVAGDRGAPAFLSLSPIDIAAPEIWIDGVPSRSPADVDPAVWDRSVAGLLAADASDGSATVAEDPRAVRLRSDPGTRGVTVLKTNFQKQPSETYLRGVSLTTPGAAKVLRLDYEEWKAEEGSPFVVGTLPPGTTALDAETPFGESKMRRFRAGLDLQTAVGRATALFGRGRRFYRGTAASLRPTERWTDEMVLGLDAPGDEAAWQVRAYHLDFADHDFAHNETRDASRLGVRAQRAPRGDGWGGMASVERVRARFQGQGGRLVLTDPTWEGHVRGGVRRSLAARWDATAALEAVSADRAERGVGLGGEVEVGMKLREGLRASAGAVRALRVPTLLETEGFQSFDLPAATPFTVVREGAGGRLPFERQDRLRAALERQSTTLHGTLAWERYWLADGVGWQPESLSAVDGVARTVSGLSLTVDQVTAQLRWSVEGARAGVTALADGHRVLGGMRHALDRGAGWPREAVGVHLRAWHSLLGHRDRLAFAYDVRRLGPRFDDRLAAYDLMAPAVIRHDLRLILKLRDAELSLGVDNVTDAAQQEVDGTTRRGREIVWGLSWPFFN